MESEIDKISSPNIFKNYGGTSGASESTLSIARNTLSLKINFLHDSLPGHTTRVYIWHSGRKGGSGVGHIAIEFDDCYVSFWPKYTPKTALHAEKGNWNDKQQDYVAEERRCPEYIQEFTSLDISKMRNKFLEIQKMEPEWHLLASTPLKPEGSLNCVYVALEILRAGGVEELAGEKFIRKGLDTTDDVLSYEPDVFDKSIKDCFNLCGSLIKCFVFIIFILCTAYAIIYGTLWKYAPKNDPILKAWDENPIMKIITPVACSISAAGSLLSMILGCKKKCCPSSEEENTAQEKHKKQKPVRIGYREIDIEALLEVSTIFGNTAQSNLDLPYDAVRGLIEHTLAPDGRMKEILDIAAENEIQLSYCIGSENKHNEWSSIERPSIDACMKSSVSVQTHNLRTLSAPIIIESRDFTGSISEKNSFSNHFYPPFWSELRNDGSHSDDEITIDAPVISLTVPQKTISNNVQ